MKWRGWARVLHRDLGYFFAGVVLIFAVSGLAVNHSADWDPNFQVERAAVRLELPARKADVSEARVREALATVDPCGHFRAMDFPTDYQIKIFLSDGSMLISLRDGTGIYETVRRRALLYSANRLHLNPKGWWLAFSDILAVGLLVIAGTGLVMLRGRKGFLGRGKWLVGAGRAGASARPAAVRLEHFTVGCGTGVSPVKPLPRRRCHIKKDADSARLLRHAIVKCTRLTFPAMRLGNPPAVAQRHLQRSSRATADRSRLRAP